MNTTRRAVTLIEILIVAVIISIVIATIVPEFSASHRDAKMSNLKYNLHRVRTQLETYRDQHGGRYPNVSTGAALQSLLSGTATVDGRQDVATVRCGPCLDHDLPENPFNGSTRVAIFSGDCEPHAATGGSEGWQYNPAHGWFYPNCSEYFATRGKLASN